MLDAFGDTTRFTARVLDQYGQEMVAAAVTYESSDEAVAAVDGSGLVTAAGNGSATVTAATGAVVGSAVVTVEQRVVEVRVSPDSVTLVAIGDTVRLAAEALDSNGHGVARADFEWTSEDSVATVDAAGLVTAAANGSATVSATSAAVAGTAAVTVKQVVESLRVAPDSVTFVAIGDTMRLVAEALDSNGHAVVSAQFDWTSDDSVATVDATGLVAAAGNGSTSVAARSGALGGSAVVTVKQVVESVRVAPDSVTFVAIRDTVRFVAEGLDSNGYAVADAEFDFRSNNEGVASVDAAGLVMALADGNAAVVVTSAPATGQAVVRVRAGSARDREVLMAFHEATGGPGWTRNFNWLSDAGIDQWYGVGTDSLDRVVEIELVGNGLIGSLPPELGRLERLTRLSLAATPGFGYVCARSNTPPTGTGVKGDLEWAGSIAEFRVPIEPLWSNRATDGRAYAAEFVADTAMHGMASLGNLSYRRNRLTGRIPAELGGLAGLEHLSLGGNKLSGPIPPELGGLVGLRYLDLQISGLSGPIPSEIGRLANLEHLLLAGNDLSGPLPPELGNLRNLKKLFLRQNEVTGSLPSELGKLVSLEELDFTCNELSGPLPPELGNLRNLQELELFGNKQSGEIPESLGRLASLTKLDIRYNYYLTGGIPPGIGGLTELTELLLAQNLLSGPIPPELSRLVNLDLLLLDNNNLTGEIPPQLGDLKNIRYLSVSGNDLTGTIPPELGGLVSLEKLQVSVNRLTGAVPFQLGNLRNLRDLWFATNQLTGPLPPELGSLPNLRILMPAANPGLTGSLPRTLTRIPLRIFNWEDTGLCAPRDRAFQTWVASIEGAWGADCKQIPREVFRAFFEATGGSGWMSSLNWLTNAPVSSWYGVTVEDSLVTGLDLSDNRLVGTLPSAVGEFTELQRLDVSRNSLAGGLPQELQELQDLETLDLSRNRFSGPVVRVLSSLKMLKRLDLSDNELEGPLPGFLPQLDALRYFRWNNSGLCAPEAPWFQTWLASIETRDGPTCEGPFTLSVAAAHLTQAAQSSEGAIPVVAGRPAQLRVFATADRANDYNPDALVTFHAGGREVHEVEMQTDGSRGVPDHYDPARADQRYQALIPGAVLRPGTEMVVAIDPDSVMPRAEFSEVRIPLDVRELPRMRLTIVPVVAESGAGGDVLDWVRSADDPAVGFMRAVLPVGDLDLTVREPFTIAQLPVAEDINDWRDLLQDIDLLRTAEAGSGYWYAVVQPEGERGTLGITYIEGRASVGIPDPQVFAHELGHNMSLRHAPCGGPARQDPDYPYADGSIGVHGYDPRADTLVDPSTPDLMSYCRPRWISDYHFNKALEYRLEAEVTSSARTAADLPNGSRLLLWGSVDAEGRLRLDPAFSLDAPAKLPSGPGPYRVEGFAPDGTSAFAIDFAMDEASEGGGGFHYLIPFEEERLASLERIVLSGPEGSVELGRQTLAPPIAIVIDQDSGRIRSVLRGEAAENAVGMAAARAPGGPPVRERVLVSYGLPVPPAR